MSRIYYFSYCYAVSFDNPVSDHVLMLRCLPYESAYQHCLDSHLILPPGFWKKQSVDCWGNILVPCGNRSPHRSLLYESAGIVEHTGEYQVADPSPWPVFTLPTALTSLAADMLMTDSIDKICAFTHDAIRYQKGLTNILTPASEAMLAGGGVCQDYAHIMIGICHNNHMPARYVVGMMEGEGRTHAWVEVWCDGMWRAYDPTHNRRVTEGYIKIAHGRDAADCQVCRGTYKGFATETCMAKVFVKEL